MNAKLDDFIMIDETQAHRTNEARSGLNQSLET